MSRVCLFYCSLSSQVYIYNSLHEGVWGKTVFQRHIKSAIVLIFGHFYGITFLIHTYKNNFTINMYLYINEMKIKNYHGTLEAV